MSFSNSGGGTLTLPSPTNVHHVDVSAAVRHLRRSLSRSPSKFLLRTASDSSDKSIGSPSPKSPSPQSPCPTPQSQRVQQQATTPATFTYSTTPSAFQPQAGQIAQTPIGSPLRSAKFALRNRPKAASAKPPTRSRLQPRSPLKRALSSNNDIGNALPPPPPAQSPESLAGQENFNTFALQFGQAARSTVMSQKAGSRHSMHLDLSGASKGGASPGSRFLDVKSETYPNNTVSPLKRTDDMMSADPMGSPVAKRRSLHGIVNFGPDFNVMDHAPTPTPPRSSFEIHDDLNNQEYKLTSSMAAIARDIAPPPSPSPNANVPKRSSSLRKSTLSQRHDPRSSWGKRAGERWLGQNSSEAATPVQRNKHTRGSLDQFMQAEPRESIFSSRSPLPNPSSHVLDRPHQPHPLSRTLTTASIATSSSGSSVTEDSPTHFPAPPPNRPRGTSIFARSLPLNAQPVISTPAYKSARPCQAAFASTGLVSKMNRNPELGPIGRGGKKLIMPDTPCKNNKRDFFQTSQNYPHNTYPPSSGSARKQRKSVVSDQTPFSPAPQPSFSVFGNSERNGGLFKNRGHSRKSSLLSFDSDVDSVLALDVDLPPTPTKGALGGSKSVSTGTISTTPFSTRRFGASPAALGASLARVRTDMNSSPLQNMGSESPKTPQESMMPPDASRLSISNHHENRHLAVDPPATPTTNFGRTSVMSFGSRRAITPVNGHTASEVDMSLARKFSKIESIGDGEFSQVFKVSAQPTPSLFAVSRLMGTPPTPVADKVYAVKKLKTAFGGVKDRDNKLREALVLRSLKDRDNILQYVDHWDENSYLYIQTEYCEEGSLEKFFSEAGFPGRLDDFRIWKILLEISQGLNSIHEAGFIHLDLKPANIFITFDGTLKIGDFGMTISWPATKGGDIEGDRQYMAREAMRGQADKPSDIFALGLIALEAASNSILPHNGPMWSSLRDGDLSGIPALTSAESQETKRDLRGVPIAPDTTPFEDVVAGLDMHASRRDEFPFSLGQQTYNPSNLFGTKRASEPTAPAFMLNSEDPGSLDTFVQWLIQPEPADRPKIADVLQFASMQWVSTSRRAPATVFEGNWGPAPVDRSPVEPLHTITDVEMTDV
ncbi:hypothetical protein PspLS_05066 [Pyricularia sp. CBS 133598]|nr:hypothetical protein PspLS_05066 [Pyricularia sp. CBS 133598]